MVFTKKVARTLGEIVIEQPADGNIYRVITTDGIFVTQCEGSLFVEDYQHGSDFEELDGNGWSVLKANIEWLRNARKAN